MIRSLTCWQLIAYLIGYLLGYLLGRLGAGYDTSP